MKIKRCHFINTAIKTAAFVSVATSACFAIGAAEGSANQLGAVRSLLTSMMPFVTWGSTFVFGVSTIVNGFLLVQKHSVKAGLYAVISLALSTLGLSGIAGDSAATLLLP